MRRPLLHSLGKQMRYCLFGVFTEGPHVSVDKLGAQDGESALAAVDSPILELVRRYPGVIKTVTVAPEVPGAQALIENWYPSECTFLSAIRMPRSNLHSRRFAGASIG